MSRKIESGSLHGDDHTEVLDAVARELYPRVLEHHRAYQDALRLTGDDVEFWRGYMQTVAGGRAFFGTKIPESALVTRQEPDGIYTVIFPMYSLLNPGPKAWWGTVLYAYSNGYDRVQGAGGMSTTWVTALNDNSHGELLESISWQNERTGGRVVLPMVIPWVGGNVDESRFS